MVLLAMVLMKILPQGLVVLFLTVLGLIFLKVLIRILSRGLAVSPKSANQQPSIREQHGKEVIKPIQVSR
jgi:hypothetical protein